MDEKLLRYNKEAIFTFFDFETTNTNLVYTRPWQFASVTGTLDKIKETHNFYIHWDDLNMSEGAAKVTKFDEDKWRENAIDNKEALLKINDIFSKSDYICGHNILGFDVPVYYNYCYRLGIQPVQLLYNLLDTFPLLKGIKLEIPYNNSFKNILQYQMKMNSNIIRKRGFATLAALMKQYKIEGDEDKYHDALYDVEQNYKGFQKMIWDINI